MLKTIQVKKLNKAATTPTRNKSNDAGIDLYALEDVFVAVGETAIVKTGIAVLVPEGFVGKIEDRSSMAAKGLKTGGGVIDAGYAGEVSVVLNNISHGGSYQNELYNIDKIDFGYQVKAGDRVAQLLIYKVETPSIELVKQLWDSERGSDGFGSSGR